MKDQASIGLREMNARGKRGASSADWSVANMAWIPGGAFLMGSDHHYPEEAPAHKVSVAGFWMDIHTVTKREFGLHAGPRARSRVCRIFAWCMLFAGTPKPMQNGLAKELPTEIETGETQNEREATIWASDNWKAAECRSEAA